MSFGIALLIMNFSIYQAFSRIPLGVAVTIEFLGPLAVAVAGSRHLRDVGWVVLAAAGVVLLTRGGHGHLDLTGVVFAVAGRGQLGRLHRAQLGDRAALPRLGGPGHRDGRRGGPGHAARGGRRAAPRCSGPPCWPPGWSIGILSSVIPYRLELEALRRMPMRLFGVWMSLEPAVAALIGLVLLGQQLSAVEWLAIGCVMVACAGAAGSPLP